MLQEPPSPASSFQHLERAARALKGTGVYTPLKGEPLTVFSMEEQIFESYKLKGRLECVGIAALGHCHPRLHGEWAGNRRLSAREQKERACRGRSRAPGSLRPEGGWGGFWGLLGAAGLLSPSPAGLQSGNRSEVEGGGPPASGVPSLGPGEPLPGSALPTRT